MDHKMKVTVIGKYGPYGKAGTGAASCYLVENDGDYLVMDMGPGTLARLMAAVDMRKVNYIYFSHLHYDHTSDFLVFRYLLEDLDRKVTVFARYENSEWYNILFSHPLIEVVNINTDSTVEVCGLTLTFCDVNHPVPCFGVTLRQKNGKTLCYSGDTLDCESVEKLLTEGDYVLLDCARHPDFNGPHMTVTQAKAFAEKHPDTVIMATHQSTEYDPEKDFEGYENLVSVQEGTTYII